MFSITDGKGFQITFGNGYTVSCQFGASNYCEKYGRHLDPDYHYGEEREQSIYSSHDCEVAIWHGREYYTQKIMRDLGMDRVDGGGQANTTPEEVAKILSYVATLKHV